MNRKRRNTPNLVFIFVVAASLCFLGTAIYAVLTIPSQINSEFGQPDPSLSTIQKIQYGIRVYSHWNEYLSVMDPKGKEILFEINQGDSVPGIAARLADLGLIKSGDNFVSLLVYKGYDRLLQQGQFYLSPTMNSLEIANKIYSSTGDRINFATIPGWRSEEIAASISSYGFEFNGTDFLAYVNKPSRLADLPPKYLQLDTLEGLLLPGSYQVDRGIKPGNLISEMIARLDESITPKMEKAYKRNGLTLYEAIILASIVEKEAMIDSEKPIIASVFYNRLAAGMRLETDPTVQYSLGYQQSQNTWWKNPLSLQDLQVNSPFNTYVVNGLPPSPICNPGIEALKSVAFPADTNYYYFRSACDGSGKHNFSNNLEEHINFACP